MVNRRDLLKLLPGVGLLGGTVELKEVPKNSFVLITIPTDMDIGEAQRIQVEEVVKRKLGVEALVVPEGVKVEVRAR